jgi:hypothetical protein
MTHETVGAGYEITIERGDDRWSWTLRADGAIRASGPAETPETARSSAQFTAAAVAALARIRRRRF